MKSTIFLAVALTVFVPISSLYCLTNSSQRCCQDSCECTRCHTFLFPRPVGANLARQSSNTIFWYDPEREAGWFDYAWTFEYNQTRHGNRIAQCILGASELKFEGLQVPHRDPSALLAEQFGLASDFKGTLKLCPKIENFVAEYSLKIELGDWCDWLKKMYFRINAPIVYTRW
ncbi:MAG TPA: hypothetical protein VHA52_01155, partial [Candidatus Babeliaceae bacterium]|nr:hypothetical protein [Candidatus Babeliaceae bacterium]